MRIAIFDKFDIKNCNSYIANMLYDPILSFQPYQAELDLKLDDFCEFSFDVPYYYVNEVTKERYRNPVYDYIKCFRNLHLNDVGFFHISSVNIEHDGLMEYKHVTAYSAEHELTHKFLNMLKVRIDEQGDDMVLYHADQPSLSVMHKVLAGTNWTVAYCDESVARQKVVLDIDRSSIYDLITEDLAKFCNCRFIFDIENFQIYIYDADHVGEDTCLNITFDNLLSNAEVSYSEDDIKTALRVEGENIYITDLNGGSDTITDLSNYAVEEWMGAELARKYPYYLATRTKRLKYYTEVQKYLDLFTKRWAALQNNYPENGQHVWEWFSKYNYEILDMYEEAIAKAEKEMADKEAEGNWAEAEKKREEAENYKYTLETIFLRRYIKHYVKKQVQSLVDTKQLLCLPEYGINYLKEGICTLDTMIEAEMEKRTSGEQEYSREHIYKSIQKFYSNGLFIKNFILRIRYENEIIPALRHMSEVLRNYYSYEGFVHDNDFPSTSNNIFKSNKWEENQILNNKLFVNDNYEFIIAKTQYLGAIEHFSELGAGGNAFGYGWSNDICKDLEKTVYNYEYSEENSSSSVHKETIPLEPIEFIYRSDGHGCNSWIYDLCYSAFMDPNGDLSNDKIKEKMGICGKPYFTKDEIRILKALESEDEYRDSNFKLHKDDSRAEILKNSQRLYQNGLTKICELNKPSLSFTADTANLFMREEFKGVIQKHLFSLGNKINIVLRNDYTLQVTIKEIHIDFSDPEKNFSFTCDNISSLAVKENDSIMRKIGYAYRKNKK
ncbi:MAG: hypothetical protein HFI75_06235 [Lachnospiraceae bacterium]|nr:hypothetical protein [Lachnospiraceae bacterium]